MILVQRQLGGASDKGEVMKAKASEKRRCSECGALLAVESGEGLDIRRGDTKVVAYHGARITCYRCGRENTFRTEQPPRLPGAVG